MVQNAVLPPLFEEGSKLREAMNVTGSQLERSGDGKVKISLSIPGHKMRLSSGACSSDEEAAERVLLLRRLVIEGIDKLRRERQKSSVARTIQDGLL